jgi:hypothetical protein
MGLAVVAIATSVVFCVVVRQRVCMGYTTKCVGSGLVFSDAALW